MIWGSTKTHRNSRRLGETTTNPILKTLKFLDLLIFDTLYLCETYFHGSESKGKSMGVNHRWTWIYDETSVLRRCGQRIDASKSPQSLPKPVTFGQTGGVRGNGRTWCPKTKWLVVSTYLKNISQNGNLPQIGVKIKNIWNHQPAKKVVSYESHGMRF